MLICIFESRPACEPAVRLLLASLKHFEPEVRVRIYCPFDEDFWHWAHRFHGVEAGQLATGSDLGWSVKPYVLLDALDSGAETALWIDSDVIVGAEFTRRLATSPNEVLVATEEALWGTYSDHDGARARAWGFEVGRTLPFTVNSAVVRVSQDHRDLLTRWTELMATPAYLEAQAVGPSKAPRHMKGDQDVLTALLASKEFSDLPLHLLRRGEDILQLFGLKAFTTRERMVVTRRGLPPFIHAQGNKPWAANAGVMKAQTGIQRWLQAIYNDVSPYTLSARSYRSALSTPTEWMEARTRLGTALRGIGLGRIALSGLPMAAALDLAYAGPKLMRRASTSLRSVSGRRGGSNPQPSALGHARSP